MLRACGFDARQVLKQMGGAGALQGLLKQMEGMK
jgi:hypothetical protein